MDHTVIRQLNQLNQKFYQTIAQAFSETRQLPWPGWETAWPNLQTYFSPDRESRARVLDLGCGNGRFGRFLASKHVQLEYIGVDQDDQLLKIAQQQLANDLPNNSVTFIKLDLIETMLTSDHFDGLHGQFDLIVILGVLHHVPSYALRKKMLQMLRELLTPDGKVMIACWQFQHNRSLFERRIDPEAVGFNSQDLEENDYFLTWEQDNSVIRYCHLNTEAEQDQLIADTQFSLVQRFVADGHGNAGNQYIILKK